MKKDFVILVLSTDKYSDTWIPFFTLFKKFWKDYSGKIYLGTEFLDFTFSGLNIICTKIGMKECGKNFTWSEAFYQHLRRIDEDYILLILDDLFLDKPVKGELIHYFFKLMLRENISLIYLTNQSTQGPFNKTETEYLLELKQNASYRISALIAFWKKDSLIKYLRYWETPWEFEIYGTRRAYFIKDKFLSVNPGIFDNNQNYVISHVYPTGITRGKWHKNVISLFEKNNIIIDFTKRGFYDENVKKSFSERLRNKFSSSRLKRKFFNEYKHFLFVMKQLLT